MDELISRQAAIDICDNVIDLFRGQFGAGVLVAVKESIEELPSAQPDIIRCRNCKFASGDSRICMKFDHSPIGELDFCSFAERREVNNESD